MIKASSAIDNLLQGLFSWSRYDAAAYCRLEAPFDDLSLITENGGLVTVFEIFGARAMPGDDDSRNILDVFYREISAAFRAGDHSIQIVFESDPSLAEREVTEAFSPSFATAARLKLESVQFLTDYAREVSRYCRRERCWLVVSTHPGTVSKSIRKRSLQDRVKYMEQEEIPFLTAAQNPLKLIVELATSHESLVRSLATELNEVGLMCRPLNIRIALRDIRMAIDPDFTDESWRPAVPGGAEVFGGAQFVPAEGKKRRERVPVRNTTQRNGNDVSHAWYPQLGRQLISRAIVSERAKEFPSSEVVRVGPRLYAPMVMEIGPQEPQTFLRLFRRVPQDTPWRIAFEFKPGGLQAMAFKKIFVSIFGWMGDTNRRLRDAFKDLDLVEKKGDPVVGFRVCAMTWADDARTLSSRHAALARAIQGWGQCDVTDDIGDPVTGFMSVVPAITDDNPAISMAAPLTDVVQMMPFFRPASPWQYGSVMFRTPDGKPFPMAVGSPEQDTWNDLLYAPPGSGKSVLLNTINYASVFAAGLAKLPLITIIDVGPSSSGFIRLVRASLPEDKQYLAAYYRLQMSADFTINMFDTQPGCRRPSPMEREMQVNFLSLLMTPIGETAPYQMAAQMSGVMIDEIFDQFSDKKRPKIYEPHFDSVVDRALEEIRFAVRDGVTTWWNVVDALWVANRQHESSIAQRYAVPSLPDFMTVVKSQVVRDLFAENRESAVEAGNGQLLIDAFATVISSALREYPVLTGATRFDLGDARILALDLDEVAREGDRRAAIMYMLAMSTALRKYFLTEQLIDIAPEIYKEFHRDRVATIKEDSKAILFDEFHRTGNLKALRDQVKQVMREGRKWNTRVQLSSQMLEDFDEGMIKLASTIYILKAANRDDVERATKLFLLSPAASMRMERDLNGPRPEGANFLAIFQTKHGRYVQLLTNTIGVFMRWALSTTAEDMALRNRFYAAMSEKEALEILVRWFPSGSARQEIINRRRALGSDDDSNVIEGLFKEILTRDSRES